MSTLVVIIIIIVVLVPIVWSWVGGIDYMSKNHPDYKGDDLFGEFEEDEKDNIL
jgi:hypothetical protein